MSSAHSRASEWRPADYAAYLRSVEEGGRIVEQRVRMTAQEQSSASNATAMSLWEYGKWSLPKTFARRDEHHRTRTFLRDRDLRMTETAVAGLRSDRDLANESALQSDRDRLLTRITSAEESLAQVKMDSENARAAHNTAVANQDETLARILSEIALEEETHRQADVRSVKPTYSLSAEERELAKSYTRRSGGSMSEVLVSLPHAEPTRAPLTLTRGLLSCLDGLNWLNDEVVNFYRELMARREEDAMSATGRPRQVWFANSFFFTKLVGSQGYEYRSVRRWTKKAKVDIFSLRVMLVPINVGNSHWTLAAIDFQKCTVTYYDSMGAPGRGTLEALFRYIQDEHVDKKGGQPMAGVEKWELVSPGRRIPQQQNCSDCGVFMSTFSNYLAEGYTFEGISQAEMPTIRLKMALEIVNKRLY